MADRQIGGDIVGPRETRKGPATPAATFPTDTANLQDCVAPALVELADGDIFDLRIGPVVKTLGDDRVRMLAYNGSIPGPTLRVPQGAEISVRVRNDADVDATVHWHGLRLDNQYDGVPYETQAPIPLGGEFTYRLRFPDAGLYWYHPHIREDYGLEMGLYGNIVVVPAEEDYWPPVNREVVITLDDILIEEGQVAPFHRAGLTHVAMGRFGNVMLTGGETRFELQARVGEVVRLYLTDTANTRIFNVALPGARMKLVGGDSGRYEHETFVEDVLLAPSERAVLDVLFDTPGVVPLQHRTPGHAYELGAISVSGEPIEQSCSREFALRRTDPELVAERARIDDMELQRPPDKTLAFDSVMPGADAGHSHAHSHSHAHEHADDTADGLEWEDLMPEMNRASDTSNMIWKLVDRDTGNENTEIDWGFHVGDRVKIRLVNDMEQDHPMHHPFHVHGAGRFLVLARDGNTEANLVWKDTVLVRAGETVDILLDVTNPGLWMAHCHIAEHDQAGMMFSFPVVENDVS
jgi:FtsP/CotA-like multicopper oxidase with cupredoxin domain